MKNLTFTIENDFVGYLNDCYLKGMSYSTYFEAMSELMKFIQEDISDINNNDKISYCREYPKSKFSIWSEEIDNRDNIKKEYSISVSKILKLNK